MGAWAGDLTAPSLVPDAVTGAVEGVKPSTACEAQGDMPRALPSDGLAVPAAQQYHFGWHHASFRTRDMSQARLHWCPLNPKILNPKRRIRIKVPIRQLPDAVERDRTWHCWIGQVHNTWRRGGGQWAGCGSTGIEE